MTSNIITLATEADFNISQEVVPTTGHSPIYEYNGWLLQYNYDYQSLECVMLEDGVCEVIDSRGLGVHNFISAGFEYITQYCDELDEEATAILNSEEFAKDVQEVINGN